MLRISYLDTSVLRKIRFGHPEHKKYLRTIPQPYYISDYVKMEFYRSVLLLYIDLYFEAEDPVHPSFSDACRVYSDRFGGVVKTLLDCFYALLSEEGFDQKLGSADSKQLCRRKLLNLIFEIGEELETLYKTVGSSHDHCTRLRRKLRLDDPRDRDEALRAFAFTFKDKKNPDKCRIKQFLQSSKFKNELQCVAQSTEKGAEKLIDNVQERLKNPSSTTCSSCGRIGDVIITANCPDGGTVHTLNEKDFRTTTPCFGKQVEFHPSLAALLAKKKEQ